MHHVMEGERVIWNEEATAEINRLRIKNDALLNALERSVAIINMMASDDPDIRDRAVIAARKVIAKAKGD